MILFFKFQFLVTVICYLFNIVAYFPHSYHLDTTFTVHSLLSSHIDRILKGELTWKHFQQVTWTRLRLAVIYIVRIRNRLPEELHLAPHIILQ